MLNYYYLRGPFSRAQIKPYISRAKPFKMLTPQRLMNEEDCNVATHLGRMGRKMSPSPPYRETPPYSVTTRFEIAFCPIAHSISQ